MPRLLEQANTLNEKTISSTEINLILKTVVMLLYADVDTILIL